MIRLVPFFQSPQYISDPQHGGGQTDVYWSALNVKSHAMGLYVIEVQKNRQIASWWIDNWWTEDKLLGGGWLTPPFPSLWSTFFPLMKAQRIIEVKSTSAWVRSWSIVIFANHCALNRIVCWIIITSVGAWFLQNCACTKLMYKLKAWEAGAEEDRT